MKISKELKDFIKKYSEEIDTNEWDKLYSSDDWKYLDLTANGQFSEIVYAAGIDPLPYMQNVPPYFLYGSNTSGDFIIPNNITNIGTYAFGCTELTSVTIGKSVTDINGFAFLGCKRLTSVIIPDNVTHISNNVFSGCQSLENISIGKGMIFIGEHAFYNCKSLTSIIYHGTKEQWDAINKDHGWNSNTGTYIIHCTDGDIKK